MRKSLVATVLSLVFWAAAGIRAQAAPVNYSMDAEQGFEFDSEAETPAGYITSMSIGFTNFPADFTVSNPTNAGTIQVVAVLTSESWGGGVTQPINFQGRLSTANRQRLANVISVLNQQGTVGPTVQFKFQIFDFDSDDEEYYPAFSSSTSVSLFGAVSPSSTTNALSVGSSPQGDITSPVNYAFTIGIGPWTNQQTLFHATGVGATVAKQWGPGIVPPAMTTLTATNISGAGALLRSSLNPNGNTGDYFYEYGTSPTLAVKLSSVTNFYPGNLGTLGANTAIAGLSPQTTYYFRAVAYNSAGRSPGNILSFNTITPAFSLANPVKTNGAFEFSFVNVSNASFTVLATTNLSLPISNWSVLGSPTQAAPGLYRFTESQTNQRFYQVRSP